MAPEHRVRKMRYVVGAGLVLVEYLQGAVLGHLQTPFMFRVGNAEGNVSWKYASRIMQMGSALFDLRNEPGFPEICNKLRNRDLQSAYFELMSAASFRLKGFAILAREESGIKTEDFDFAVQKGDIFANVEVTSLRARDFSAQAIAGKLRKKRTQLPTDAPAIIVCVTPSEWYETVVNLDDQLRQIAVRWLTNTRRVNWVMFAAEEFHEHDDKNGTVVFTSFAVRNLDPRMPSPALDALMLSLPPTHFMAERIRGDFEWARRARPGSGVLIDWVDWALGTQFWRGFSGAWYKLSYDQE